MTLLIEPKHWATAASTRGIQEIRAGKTFDLTGVRDFESALALYLEVAATDCCTIKIRTKFLRRLRGLSHFRCTFDCFVAEISGSGTISIQGNYLCDPTCVKTFLRAFRPVFLRNIAETAIFVSCFFVFSVSRDLFCARLLFYFRSFLDFVGKFHLQRREEFSFSEESIAYGLY